MLPRELSFFFLFSCLCGLSSCTSFPSSTTPVAIKSSTDVQLALAPTSPPLENLGRRDRPPTLCGFGNGDAAYPWNCNSGYACAVDTYYSVLGCVTSMIDGKLTGYVPTSCLNYGQPCSSVGTRTICCTNTVYPSCLANVYTGSLYSKYTLLACGDGYNRRIAWFASTTETARTTGTGTTSTPFMMIPQVTNVINLTDGTNGDSPPPGTLTTSDKITLATTLGIGLPATVAGVVAAWFAYKARKAKKLKMRGERLASSDDDASHLHDIETIYDPSVRLELKPTKFTT